MEQETKNFLGLLNGIIRFDYYQENDMTDGFLKEELYPSISQEEFQKMTQKSRGLIKSMSSTHMDLNQTEAFLTSQTKKKDGGITEAQAKVFLKVWKSHRSRIHDNLVERSAWNNKLKNLKWRIDVKSQTKQNEQINVPTAIVELQLESRQTDEKESEVVRFEMDDSSMSRVLHSLKEIEEQLQIHCKK